MRRIVKALAVSLPLFLAVACSDECSSPDDCDPGQLCIRPVTDAGDRGPYQCVAATNPRLNCATDSDCPNPDNNPGLFRCMAQVCILTVTSTPTGSADSGVTDSGDAGSLDATNLDATPNDAMSMDAQNMDAMSSTVTPDGSVGDGGDAGELGDTGTGTTAGDAGEIGDTGTGTVSDAG